MAVIKYFVERRFIKIVFSKVRNATGGISTCCKLALPKTWMDKMGISSEDRLVSVDFDPEKKSIEISKAYTCNKVILSKDIIKNTDFTTDSKFSVGYNKKNKTIILTKIQKGDRYESI